MSGIRMRSRPGRPGAVTLLALVMLFAAPAVSAGQGNDGERVDGDAHLPRRPLVARMDSALRTAFPPAEHGWLWADGRSGERAGIRDGCPEPVYEAVLRAARRGGEASGDRRYAWWLAADRRAAEGCNHWFELNADTAGWIQKRRRALGDVGLRYGYSELGGVWVYQRDLLRRTWKEAPDTRWGHLAFARLQDMGWDPTGTCAGGNEQFGAVIERGERFLARRKPAPFLRAVVETTVARAYETMWSISQTTARDMGIFDYPFGPDTPREYRERAAAAARDRVEGDGEEQRRTALALYRSVAESPAAGPELRAYARAKVERLEARQNTHQYAYYCVHD